MAAIKIPCLVGKTSKGGVTSWYWQPSATLKAAGWQPLTLGKDRSAAIAQAEARNAEVEQWKRGGPRPSKVDIRREQGTLAALITRYRKDVLNGRKPSGAPLLRSKTRAIYETSLKRLEDWAGKHPVSYVTPARVAALRDAVARPVDDGGIGHASAFNLLRMGRQLYAYAERLEGELSIQRGTNPFGNFALAAPPRRRQIWEAEDEAAFIAAAYDLGLPGMALAMELALYSAQRRGDLLAFTEAQLEEIDIFDPAVAARFADGNGKVRGWCFNQQKTSTDEAEVRMEIPIEPGLLARIDAAIRTNRARDRAATPARLLTYVLVDDRTGKPWKPRAFHDAWTAIVTHAVKATGRTAMDGLVWHDLRRTRVVRLRRRRMPKEMIASITGHSLQSIEEMLAVYGPVDPTVTASALATTLEDPTPITKARRPARKGRSG